jgi:endonuclease/exonuclease/phosphatase family metal-dependent hydrolase
VRLAGLAIGLGAAACAGRDRPIEVLIDGSLSDWDRSVAVVVDPLDAPPDAAVDLAGIRLADDPHYLYFQLDIGRSVNAQSHRGFIRLLLDADGDAATGPEVAGVAGVDFAVELSRQDVPRLRGYGGGTGVRIANDTGLGPVRHGAAAGLLVAPTTAASRFELRLRRWSPPSGAAPLFAGRAVRIKALSGDAGGVRDETVVGTYRLRSRAARTPPPSFEGSLAKTPRTHRVMAWNVAGDRLWEQAESARRVFAAIGADLVLLDELARDAAPERIASLLPGTGWKVLIGSGGGRQRGAVAARLALEPAVELERVPYRTELGRLIAAFGDPASPGLEAREQAAGIATTGAWVGFEGQLVLAVPVDLQSAGYAGSGEDQLRIVQAEHIRERLDHAMAARPGGAVVLGGDLNLVGSTIPLDRLRAGSPRLEPVDAFRLADRSQVTWRADGAPFTPGRLDFILVSPSLAPVRAFVFDPEDLGERLRAELGIERGDARAVSDHLPVVVDLVLRSGSGGTDR